MNGVKILACVLLLAGCSMTRTARLYPADAASASGGVIEAKFTDSGMGSGNGKVDMTAPNGEVFKGEYSIVRGGAIGFGAIFGTVYSAEHSINYNGSSTSYATEGKSQGFVFAIGSNGTRMDCEFLNDNWSGHGFGACKTSSGLIYKLAY